MYAIFNDQSFNDMLTNDLVSFELLGQEINTSLTFTTLWAYSAGDTTTLFFPENNLLNFCFILCKLSPWKEDNLHEMSKSIFWESMLNVKILDNY